MEPTGWNAFFWLYRRDVSGGVTGPLLRVGLFAPRLYRFTSGIPLSLVSSPTIVYSLWAFPFDPALRPVPLRFVGLSATWGSSSRITLSVLAPPPFLVHPLPLFFVAPASRPPTLHDLIKHRRLDCHSTLHPEQSRNAWRVSPCLPFSVAVGGHTHRREPNPQDLKSSY